MKAKKLLSKVMALCLSLACLATVIACEHVHQHNKSVQVTCDQGGLITYKCKCGDEYTEVVAAGHDVQTHAAKAPTCTEVGWEEYETCKREGCDYTTYVEIPASHDEKLLFGQAPTCTQVGWAEYVTCQREGCDYTTYTEIPASHDLQTHAAQQPSYTQVGWEEYVTCQREGCDYTTYVEIAKLDAVIGLMIIIDSGASMGLPPSSADTKTYLDYAKEAARAAINQLSSNDYVGFLSFNMDFSMTAPLALGAHKSELLAGVEAISIDGSAMGMFPDAIELAGQALAQLEVEERHILFISDGFIEVVPVDTYENLIRDFKEEDGTTLSIALIGNDEATVTEKGSDYSEADLTDEVVANDVYMQMLRAVVIGDGYFYFIKKTETNKLITLVKEDMLRLVKRRN